MRRHKPAPEAYHSVAAALAVDPGDICLIASHVWDTIGAGAAGWLAARKYLEARGAKVTLWREPLDRFSGKGVLVVAFPCQHGQMVDASDAIEAHLQRGGTVVLAWSGGSA